VKKERERERNIRVSASLRLERSLELPEVSELEYQYTCIDRVSQHTDRADTSAHHPTSQIDIDAAFVPVQMLSDT